MLINQQTVAVMSFMIAIALLCSGCNDGTSVNEPLGDSTSGKTEEVKDKTEEKQITKTSEEEEAEEPTTVKEPKVTFEAPFPERVNLFQAPKRQNTGLAKIKKGNQETSVELLGFVNVDQQRAVLAVNGLVAPIAEGGEHYGIEVISIQPPTVVLQRGRQRWQTTLEN